MNNKRVGILWFTNDCRIHDHPLLVRTNNVVDELICVHIPHFHFLSSYRSLFPYYQTELGAAKKLFHLQSQAVLAQQLQGLGQSLVLIEDESPINELSSLIQRHQVTDIFVSVNTGIYEQRLLAQLQTHFPKLGCHIEHTHTLFFQQDLPFTLMDLPPTFTQFKKAVKNCNVCAPLQPVTALPSVPARLASQSSTYIEMPAIETGFEGGEIKALAHLRQYFSSNKPSYYKKVRNELSGWDNSTKFSPWLANGNLSVRELYAALLFYEQETGANESTYWIYFELLWREYFQWYAHRYGCHLFRFYGIKKAKPLTSFYPERFAKWVNGSTPFAIVNACMRELKETGFLSNRGRQIVASCFVNEMALDWRYGAAYFETALIDYDMGSNWGNWQYLAGVGADIKDKRHFNLDKQTSIFDPKGEYVNRWQGNQQLDNLDTVDISDWPISE